MDTTDETLAQIAKKHLRIQTLETQNSDSLDFHDTAVWAVRSALEAAFAAGRATTAPPCRSVVEGNVRWIMAFPDKHSDAGFDSLEYESVEMDEILNERAPSDDARFLAKPDVRALIHRFGLQTSEVAIGRDQ